jgi:hypothetical protein
MRAKISNAVYKNLCETLRISILPKTTDSCISIHNFGKVP